MTAIFPVARFRKPQRAPRLQRPRHRRHHHLRPVRMQIIHRSAKGTRSVLHLFDHVRHHCLQENTALVAAIIAREHDFFRRGVTIVRDVEEIQDVVEQDLLAFFYRKVFPNHDHAILFFARCRLVSELRHIFAILRSRNIGVSLDSALCLMRLRTDFRSASIFFRAFSIRRFCAFCCRFTLSERFTRNPSVTCAVDLTYNTQYAIFTREFG